jgi:hypothetical protein
VLKLWYYIREEKGDRDMNKEELLRELDNVKWGKDSRSEDKEKVFKELLKIVLEVGADDLLEHFMNYSMLSSMARSELMSGGVQAIRNFLYEVNYFDCDVFYLDGYGNARNVLWTDLYVLKMDLRKEIEKL